MTMEEINGYFTDDGNPLNPDLIPKPGLCLVCRKDSDPYEEIFNNLNRLDQRNQDKFVFYAFGKIN